LKTNTRRSNGFPEAWQDPLELYECLKDDLTKAGYNLSQERDHLLDLVNRYGAEWVWDNRHRLLELSGYFKDCEMRAGGPS
jgi:hypothetical protein